MRQHSSNTRCLMVILLVVAGVVVPLWAVCDVACMPEDMACCDIGPVPNVASPACPSSPELSERATVATLTNRDLTAAAVPVVEATVATRMHNHGVASPLSSSGTLRTPSTSLFLFHSVLLR